MAQDDQPNQGRTPWYTQVYILHSLQQRDWRILWMAGHIWHLTFWMELIILGWLVLEMTGSPFLVSLVGTFRLLPLGILGFFFGAMGDRFPKRQLLVLAQVTNTSVTVALGIILFLDVVHVWHIYVACLLTGAAWAADFPIRRALIRELIPEHSVVNAMSLDAASLTGMNMVGRFIGGGLLALIGIGGSYIFLSLCYVLGLFLLLRVSKSPIHESSWIRQKSVVTGLKQGLQYCFRDPALRGVLIVTFVFNLLVSPYMMLTPVFARDVLIVGPILLGLMAGMEGFGAVLGAMVLASASSFRRLGLIFLLGTFAVSCAISVFSISTVYLLSCTLLFIAGLGLSGFATMQTTITTTIARADMRARAMGVLVLAVGTMPVGIAYVGFLASRVGAPMAVGLNSLACVVFLLAVIAFQPGLRRFSV